MSKVKIAEVAKPPKTTVPIPLYNSEPDPGKITNGINPNKLVKVDINIGLILFFVASLIASAISIFSYLICHKVCSTIKIELLTTIPAKIIKPNIVSMSKGWGENWFKITNPITPPAPATGTVIIITKGRINDLIKTVSNKKITKSAIITLFFIATHVRSNSLAAPDRFIEMPWGLSFSIGSTTNFWSFKTASSKEILSCGRNCIVKTRRPDNLFICSGTPNNLISATWDNLISSPVFVIKGKSFKSSILLVFALLEVSTKSINLPSNGISATRTPSLYASNDFQKVLRKLEIIQSIYNKNQ